MWAKIDDIEKDRQEQIESLNDKLDEYYDNLVVYDPTLPESVTNKKPANIGNETYEQFIKDNYKACLDTIDKISEYHGKALYTKEDVETQYKKCTSAILAEILSRLEAKYGQIAVNSDLKIKLNKADNDFIKAKKDYEEDPSYVNESSYNKAKEDQAKYTKQWEEHCTLMDRYYAEAVALLKDYTEAGGTAATITEADIKKSLDEAKNRNLNPEENQAKTNGN